MFSTYTVFIAALGISSAAAELICTSQSQPNPIAASNPNNVTGTLNGTLAILPIPLDEAQRIVAPYTIQTAAYRSLLPSFPVDMYPALIQAVLDHDVQQSAFKIPDFSRSSIDFPFVSIPGANPSTPFRYGTSQAILATNLVAITGSASYGTRVVPAVFDPPCDAYARHPDGSTYLDVCSTVANGAAPLFRTQFDTADEAYADGNAALLAFFVNVTNQPSFTDPAKGCDQQIRMFDTKVSQAPYEPVVVKGDVWASEQVYSGSVTDGGRMWEGAWAVRTDSAFIELNGLKCDSL